jgi:leucyl aminopeptidase
MRWLTACWRARRRKTKPSGACRWPSSTAPAAVQLAELNNTGSAAYPAGASTAAGFLSHFVENYHQGWLHIDCSATYRKAAVEQWSAARPASAHHC